jgi:hypothetical protein
MLEDGHTLEHDWEAQSFTFLSCFVGTFHQTFGAGHDGHSGLLGEITGN